MTDLIGRTRDSIGGNLNVNAALGINIMMLLGEYRFCISNAAYQTLKRQTEYQWEAINRIGAEPALQYTGKAVETIELEGVVYPEFQGGLAQVTLMRAHAGLGIPFNLISGNGFAFGRWCIAALTENQSIFLKDGTPRKMEFSMTLRKYGEDKVSGVKGMIQTVGSAL